MPHWVWLIVIQETTKQKKPTSFEFTQREQKKKSVFTVVRSPNWQGVQLNKAKEKMAGNMSWHEKFYGIPNLSR